jgi:pyruvate dehydrogenase E1 component
MIPNCISYDPTFAYELAVIIQDGMRRMFKDQDNVFYYLTVMNENYHQPAMPKGVEKGIIKGIYLFQKGGRKKKRVQLIGSGAIFREVIAAAELLAEDWGVDADLWSVTSFNELCREGRDCDRWNMLHPDKKPRIPYVSKVLEGKSGPMIAATDYIKNYAEQLRPYVPGAYKVLGTDGFGRSDTREKLRKHFEVNRYYITVAALKSLADEGGISTKEVVKAIDKYAIDPDKANPLHV